MNTTAFTDLSQSMQLGLGALIILQLLLMVVSFLMLTRIRTGTIAGAPRWLWVVVILLGQIFGSLTFLAAAYLDCKARRERADFQVPTSAPGATIINDLYGTPER